MSTRLGLGTVQFGMTYGVSNTSGRPKRSEMATILSLARLGGMTILDTAIAYGDSETLLGQAGVKDWQVVTKLPTVPDDVSNIAVWMEKQVSGSLARLGLEQLYGVLLHNPAQMHGPRAAALARALEHLHKQGLARRVGVSIQHANHDLPAVLRHLRPSLIQCPFNLLDDDLVAKGWAMKLGAMGCEIHTRSAFLQGLLLMSSAARPAWFDRWSRHWEVWQDWLAESGLEASDACLRFVRSQPDIDCCVVGVDSAEQLRAVMNAGSDPLPSLPPWPAPAEPDLITPSRWIL